MEYIDEKGNQYLTIDDGYTINSATFPKRRERILILRQYYDKDGNLTSFQYEKDGRLIDATAEPEVIVHPSAWDGEGIINAITTGFPYFKDGVKVTPEQVNKWYLECLMTPYPEIRDVLHLGVRVDSILMGGQLEFVAHLESFDEYLAGEIAIFQGKVAEFAEIDKSAESDPDDPPTGEGFWDNARLTRTDRGTAKIRITVKGKVVDEIRTQIVPTVPNGSLVAFAYRGQIFTAGHIPTKKGREDYFVSEIGDWVEVLL